ncbi:MAG: metallophosphoesterase [Armatimonadetes bacterium]|nr:metallophosphoesterase [Armatimonadota bacterium]
MTMAKTKRSLIVLVVLALALPCLAQEKGLVGRWVLDSQYLQGKTLKARVGPDGQILGQPEFAKVKGVAFATFSGRGDSILLLKDIAGALDKLPRRELTVEVWVAVNKPLEWGGILGAMQDNRSYEKGWLLGFRGDRFALAVSSKGADDGDGLLTYMTAKDPFEKGQWYHVAGVYDGKTMRLYVNGKLAASDDKAQSGDILYPPHAYLELAAYHDADEYNHLDGAVAEARLYARALSAQEIAAHFAAGKAILAAAPPKLDMLAGPYLMHVTQNSIRIMWETAEPATSEVLYGPSAAELKQKASSTDYVTIHEVKLTGLKPETIYFYEVRSVSKKGAVARSDVYCFRTALHHDTPFAFAVVGDTRTYPERFARLCDLCWRERPDLVVNVGDVVSNGQVKQQWIDEWLKPGTRLMAYVPTYVAIGNHERNAQWFYKYVSYPPPEDYYSFDYGNAHFTIIDTNQDIKPGSKQYQWIERDLASSRATWKFVFHHHPQYSTDSDDYGNAFEGPSELGDLDTRVLVPLYEKYHVDMVFYGHIHDYERTWPLLQGKPVTKGGVIYVQTGGGGAELEDFGPLRSAFTAKMYSGWQYCILTVHGSYLRMVVRDIDGKMIDWLELKK